jgi:hypothetical protein
MMKVQVRPLRRAHGRKRFVWEGIVMKGATAMAFFALALGMSACASVAEYEYVSVEPVKNVQGHVIGRKETLRDIKTGDQIEQSTAYEPRLDPKGVVIGYEERVPGGAVLRSLDGRRIGVRNSDLRSRSQNPQNQGVTITIMP